MMDKNMRAVLIIALFLLAIPIGLAVFPGAATYLVNNYFTVGGGASGNFVAGNGINASALANEVLSVSYVPDGGIGFNSTGAIFTTGPPQQSYYLNPALSNVTGDNSMAVMPLVPSVLTYTTPALPSGNIVVANYITNLTGISFLPFGVYVMHIHASQASGTANVQLFGKIYVTHANGGVIGQIGTTQLTPVLSGTQMEYRVAYTDSNPYFMSANERLELQVVADVSSTGTSPTISIYTGQNDDSHLAVPSALLSSVDNITGQAKILSSNSNIIVTTAGQNIILTGSGGGGSCPNPPFYSLQYNASGICGGLSWLTVNPLTNTILDQSGPLLAQLGWDTANTAFTISTQKIGTPINTIQPFQQQITFDPASYTSYEASNLGNIRFYQGSSELYSWCEFGCNSIATNAIFWVMLPAGINAVATANMVFLSTSTQYDGIYAGEAPQLTCNNPSNTISGCTAGQYAKYDNGNSVFSFYDNFNGITLRSSWHKENAGVTAAVANSLSLTVATGDGNWHGIYNNYDMIANTVMEADVNSPNGAYGLLTAGYDLSDGFGTGYISAEYRYDDLTFIPTTNEWGLERAQSYAYTYGGVSQKATSYLMGLPYIASSELYVNYTPTITPGFAPITPVTAPLYLGSYHYGTPPFTVQWVRTRAYPPNGVMPALTLGSEGSSTIGGAIGQVPLIFTNSQNTAGPSSLTFAASTVNVIRNETIGNNALISRYLRVGKNVTAPNLNASRNVSTVNLTITGALRDNLYSTGTATEFLSDGSGGEVIWSALPTTYTGTYIGDGSDDYDICLQNNIISVQIYAQGEDSQYGIATQDDDTYALVIDGGTTNYVQDAIIGVGNTDPVNPTCFSVSSSWTDGSGYSMNDNGQVYTYIAQVGIDNGEYSPGPPPVPAITNTIGKSRKAMK